MLRAGLLDFVFTFTQYHVLSYQVEQVFHSAVN